MIRINHLILGRYLLFFQGMVLTLDLVGIQLCFEDIDDLDHEHYLGNIFFWFLGP